MFRNIITTLLSFITLIGYAQQAESRERNTDSQIKCHIEGSLETDAWGDDIIICEDGTDLRAAVFRKATKDWKILRWQFSHREL